MQHHDEGASGLLQLCGYNQSAKTRAQASRRLKTWAKFDTKADYTSRDSNVCHVGN